MADEALKGIVNFVDAIMCGEETTWPPRTWPPVGGSARCCRIKGHAMPHRDNVGRQWTSDEDTVGGSDNG